MAKVVSNGRTSAGSVIAANPGAALVALAAFLSFVLSVTLWFTDNHEEALFVGLWVPSILSAGALWAALGSARS